MKRGVKRLGKVFFLLAMLIALGTSNMEVKAAKAANNSTGPSITVKKGNVFTIGNTEKDVYKMVSFKLYDANKVDYVIINGHKKNLTNNKYSDINFVSIGKAYGIEGENVLEAYDTLGNMCSYMFYLDNKGPQIVVKEGEEYTKGNKEKNIFSKVSFKLIDSGKVDYVVINGHKKDLTDNTYSDANFISVGKAYGVEGKNIIEAYDIAGNVSKYTFYLDSKEPKITVKDGADFTIGDKEVARFSKVSFKLYDAGKVDYVVINGHKKDLTDNKYSDVNFISVGKGYGIEGENVIEAYDIAGNISTYTFYLDNSGPTIKIKEGEEFTTGDKETATFSKVSFKLIDPSKVDYIVINGKKVDLTNNTYSDWNFVAIGSNYGVEGQNKIIVYDTLGNCGTYIFWLTK